MNILYITLSEPRLSESGIYPDLVRALCKAGHKVTIVYAASPRKQKETELAEENGVSILKVVVGENFDVGLLRKGINTLMMEPRLRSAIKRFLADRTFDVCIYATPPVTFAGVVSYCKKKYGLKTFLMLKDIFPQNAVDIGLFPEGSFIHRFFRRKERRLYELSDHIGCMSEGNVRYIKEHEPWLDPKKLFVFPNTIEVSKESGVTSDHVKPQSETEEEPLESGGGPVRFVFGGNLGKPQAILWLISAICDPRLTERKDIEFYIIGQGSEKEKVRRAAEKADNLFYIEQLPVSEYEEKMKEMDVGMICLDHRFTIPNFPSRILSYMKAGMPVLACTDEVTDIRDLVERQALCGLWRASNDINGFVDAVFTLAGDRRLRLEMGERGRRYLKENFDVRRSVELIEQRITGKG